MFRFLKLIPLLFLLLLAGAGWWFISSAPLADGLHRLTGISANVKVLTDARGVPHIFASNEKDAAAALGYLHASNRFFQMEMTRRAGAGRLSEILGEDLLNFDKKMRLLRFYRLVQQNFAELSPELQAVLRAYAAGVNAFLQEGPLPPEFALLGIKPAVWQPYDGLYWAKMMSWQLAGDLDGEIFRAGLLQKGVSKAQIEILYPPMDGVPVTTKPFLRDQGAGIGDEGKEIPTFPQRIFLSEKNEAERLPDQASNIYVLAGSRTQSGKPILANDPHLQLQAPVLWYLARIVLPEGEVKGATAPGLPLFPLGQNRDVAWGFTTSNIDVQDITFVDEASTAIAVREEIIQVKDGSEVKVKLRLTPLGPVISDVMADVAAVTPAGKMAVLQSTLLAQDDRTAEAIWRINHAGSAKDVIAATRDYVCPPQNLMFADWAGSIGYRAVGQAPQRTGNGFYMDENRAWQGWLATSHVPFLDNHEAGVLFNANNALVDAQNCAGFSCMLARDWPEPYRAMRLSTLLQTMPRADVTEAAQPMLDITSVAAQRLLPLLLPIVNNSASPEIVAALRGWDARMQKERPEPLIFHAWMDALNKKLFGAVYLADLTWPRFWSAEHALRGKETDVRTAFAEAVTGLQVKYGTNWKNWRWGDAHRAALAHGVWSKVPLLKNLFSLEVAADGDGHTLRRAASVDMHDPFADAHGAGYRAAYDLAVPEKSLFVIATGQSGHPASRHYGDFVKLWSEGKFVTIGGDAAALEKAGAQVMEFVR
jgi:penicillin amidase